MMAVAIAVTVMTEGAGAEMIGAASGSMEATIANAAVSSMASSAATGVLTGNFDLGNVLKAGLTGGLTAGLTQGLGFNQTAGIKDLGNGIVKGQFNPGQLGDALMGIAGRGLVNAGVNSAINGTSFSEGFKQSVINDAAAIGASAIGTKWGSGPDANPVLQTVAHAGLGAITAKLRGQDVVAGAIGGATESVIGNLVDAAGGLPKNPDGTVSNATKAIYTAAATLAGGLVANATGRDAVTAGQTAQNSALNNYLTHAEVDKLLKDLDECKGNGACRNRLVTDAVQLSNSRNPFDLLDPSLAADVKAGSNLLQAASNIGSNGFAMNSGLQSLFGINTSQTSIANSAPVLKAPERPTGFDTQLAPSVVDALLLEGGNALLGAAIKGVGAAWSVVKGETAGIVTETSRVGRWMSQTEYNAMVDSGKVQESFSGTTHVASPADGSAFINQAKPGSLYIEFDVPTSSLKATNYGWSKVIGPNSLEGRLADRKGLPIPQMPTATNIIHSATKLP
jgi:hypothetical protein